MAPAGQARIKDVARRERICEENLRRLRHGNKNGWCMMMTRGIIIQRNMPSYCLSHQLAAVTMTEDLRMGRPCICGSRTEEKDQSPGENS